MMIFAALRKGLNNREECVKTILRRSLSKSAAKSVR